MKIGDLVRDLDAFETYPAIVETGIIITIMADVEIPPLIEVMWEDGIFSRCYADQLVVVEACQMIQ